jgi:hypothetical protein
VCVRRRVRVRVRPCRRDKCAYENGARGRHVAVGAVDARCLLDGPRAPRPSRRLLQPGWSGASATATHAIDRCIRILGSAVERADGRFRSGTLAAAHRKDIDARTHAQPGSESGSARGGCSGHQLEVDERERNRDRCVFGRVDPAVNPRMCGGRLRMRARQRVPVRVRCREGRTLETTQAYANRSLSPSAFAED